MQVAAEFDAVAAGAAQNKPETRARVRLTEADHAHRSAAERRAVLRDLLVWLRDNPGRHTGAQVAAALGMKDSKALGNIIVEAGVVGREVGVTADAMIERKNRPNNAGRFWASGPEIQKAIEALTRYVVPNGHA